MDTADLSELKEVLRFLESGGIHEALRYLNSRTPHRFSGIYRYDGEILRNEALFDRDAPDVRRGDDVPMADAYCAIVGERRVPLEFGDIHTEYRITIKPGSSVVSYCGVLIESEDGAPFGTLCHFDLLPCEERINDIPLLEATAPYIFKALEAGELRNPPA
jgi:hypothetical protein